MECFSLIRVRAHRCFGDIWTVRCAIGQPLRGPPPRPRLVRKQNEAFRITGYNFKYQYWMVKSDDISRQEVSPGPNVHFSRRASMPKINQKAFPLPRKPRSDCPSCQTFCKHRQTCQGGPPRARTAAATKTNPESAAASTH